MFRLKVKYFLSFSLIASGAGNLETATQMYHTLSKQMFGNTSLIGGMYIKIKYKYLLLLYIGNLSLKNKHNIQRPLKVLLGYHLIRTLFSFYKM